MLKTLTLAAAALLLSFAAQAETLTGTITEIDAAKATLFVGRTKVTWKAVKPDGFKVGDEVRITYTQDDVHDPYVLVAITKK
jgi:hypothetical protein